MINNAERRFSNCRISSTSSSSAHCNSKCNVQCIDPNNCRCCCCNNIILNDHTYSLLKKICRKIIKHFNKERCRERYSVFDGGKGINIKIRRSSHASANNQQRFESIGAIKGIPEKVPQTKSKEAAQNEFKKKLNRTDLQKNSGRRNNDLEVQNNIDSNKNRISLTYKDNRAAKDGNRKDLKKKYGGKNNDLEIQNNINLNKHRKSSTYKDNRVTKEYKIQRGHDKSLNAKNSAKLDLLSNRENVNIKRNEKYNDLEEGNLRPTKKPILMKDHLPSMVMNKPFDNANVVNGYKTGSKFEDRFDASRLPFVDNLRKKVRSGDDVFASIVQKGKDSRLDADQINARKLKSIFGRGFESKAYSRSTKRRRRSKKIRQGYTRIYASRLDDIGIADYLRANMETRELCKCEDYAHKPCPQINASFIFCRPPPPSNYTCM